MTKIERAEIAARTIVRNKLLAFGYALLILNATPTFVSEAVSLRGLTGAILNLFDISAIIWVAIAACLMLLWNSEDRTLPTPHDWLMIGFISAVSLLPSAALSGVALSIIGMWGAMRFSAGTDARRASLILVSLSAFFFWGRTVLALGAGPMLAIDAQLVAWISGLPATDNVISFVDGSTFVIAPGCSSLHGVSLAVVLWTTGLMWFNFAITWRLCLFLALSIFASIGVNAARLVVIGWNPDQFDYWHVGEGGMLFGWIALIAVTFILFTGIRNELVKA
jgi:exosortase/archaeosortase family protein